MIHVLRKLIRLTVYVNLNRMGVQEVSTPVEQVVVNRVIPVLTVKEESLIVFKIYPNGLC